MSLISKDMLISDILAVDRGIIPILLNVGMHCVGCPSAQGETLEQASEAHGINAEDLVVEINSYLNQA